MLILVLAINFLGTVYGYYWYLPQLLETPARFLIFVPDSPTATFFFLFVLLAFLMKRNAPLLEALALVTLVKYGLWAVAMNFLVLAVTGDLPWEGYMLMLRILQWQFKAYYTVRIFVFHFGILQLLQSGHCITMSLTTCLI